MKIGNNEITHIENGIMFTPIYDLEGVCQDCIYLEKIRPLFEEKDKEIERLNNIINELEKWLEEQVSKSDLKGCSFEQTYITGKWNAYKKSLNKLQELKGDISNE